MKNIKKRTSLSKIEIGIGRESNQSVYEENEKIKEDSFDLFYGIARQAHEFNIKRQQE